MDANERLKKIAGFLLERRAATEAGIPGRFCAHAFIEMRRMFLAEGYNRGNKIVCRRLWCRINELVMV
jgi:hypothetical protein